MIYQLTYELRSADKDYSDFFEYLEKNIDAETLHILKDTWWMAADKINIDELCKKIKGFLNDDDVFFVTIISDTDTNGWMANNTWKWFREHKMQHND